MARMLGHTLPVDKGGRGCTCCYHPPKWRETMRRVAKRSERQTWKREVRG